MDFLGIKISAADVQLWLEQAWAFAGPRLLTTVGIAGGAFVAYWIGKRVLDRVCRLVTRTASRIDDMVARLVQRTFVMSVIFWTIWRLTYIWTMTVAADFVAAAWIVALSLPAGQFVVDLMTLVERRLVTRTATALDDTALPMINKVIRFLVIGLGVLLALQYLNVNVAPLMAGAGVAGLAVSLAARDTLSNLIAGVLLIIDRPFHVGDRIELWSAPLETGTWGDVVEIGLRATTIRNPDNLIMVIPNNEIMRRDIVNYTASGSHIRLRIPIGIAFDADENLAKELILQAARETEGVKETPDPLVIVRSFGQSEVQLQLRVWIKQARERRAISDAITGRVRQLFQEHGVEIPYPKRDIYVRSVPPSGTAAAPESRPDAPGGEPWE
jgi:small-conductance mechanosensitive channel